MNKVFHLNTKLTVNDSDIWINTSKCYDQNKQILIGNIGWLKQLWNIVRFFCAIIERNNSKKNGYS